MGDDFRRQAAALRAAADGSADSARMLALAVRLEIAADGPEAAERFHSAARGNASAASASIVARATSAGTLSKNTVSGSGLPIATEISSNG